MPATYPHISSRTNEAMGPYTALRYPANVGEPEEQVLARLEQHDGCQCPKHGVPPLQAHGMRQ